MHTPRSVDIAIMSVIPEEYDAVITCIPDISDAPSSLASPNIYGWKLGKIPTKEGKSAYSIVVGLTARVGGIAGALATITTIDQWRPTYVFFVGVAEGFDVDGVKKGDV